MEEGGNYLNIIENEVSELLSKETFYTNLIFGPRDLGLCIHRPSDPGSVGLRIH